MLKMPMTLPWLPKRSSEPKIYDLHCPKCGWGTTVEIGKADADSRCVHGEESALEIRETLPDRCRKCGAKLKKRRLRVCLRD